MRVKAHTPEIPPAPSTTPIGVVEPEWKICTPAENPHAWKIGESICHLKSKNFKSSFSDNWMRKGEWTLYLKPDGQINVLVDSPTSIHHLVKGVFPETSIFPDQSMTLPELLTALSYRERYHDGTTLNKETRYLIQLANQLAERECNRVLDMSYLCRTQDWDLYANFFVLYRRYHMKLRIVLMMCDISKDWPKSRSVVPVAYQIIQVYHHRGMDFIRLSVLAIGDCTTSCIDVNSSALKVQEIYFPEEWNFLMGSNSHLASYIRSERSNLVVT